MTSRVFDVSFRSEARRITVNDMTKIGHFIEKSIGIYDLNVDDISGVYFVDDDNEEAEALDVEGNEYDYEAYYERNLDRGFDEGFVENYI